MLNHNHLNFKIMSYDYDVKPIPSAWGLEWAVTETDYSETKELICSNTNIIGMFADKALAYEYIEKRKENARRNSSATARSRHGEDAKNDDGR